MTKIKPQPGILDISPYVGGSSKVDGVENVVKLSSNENPFGPSEAAKEAFRKAGFDLHRYPSTGHEKLRAAIGEVHGLDPERVICGVGSDEILSLLCQAYAGAGDEVIHTEHGFAIYKISIILHTPKINYCSFSHNLNFAIFFVIISSKISKFSLKF